jgi:hypothetical protein
MTLSRLDEAGVDPVIFLDQDLQDPPQRIQAETARIGVQLLIFVKAANSVDSICVNC